MLSDSESTASVMPRIADGGYIEAGSAAAPLLADDFEDVDP
jgi:hypothetical protein